MKKTMIATTALMSVLMVSTVSANESRGFYLGGAIGTSGFDDGGLFEKSLVPIEAKAEDSTYKIIAGYQFNHIAAIEAQYTNYGDITFTSPSPMYRSGISWTPKILSLSANLGYTFDNGIRPFGIIGVTSIDLDESIQSSTIDIDNGGGVRYGFGIEYIPYNPYETYADVSFRLGYEADTFAIETGVGDKDIVLDSYYVAVNFRF
ncbi:porin family protein [Moritella marina ATCC 15381]|uniref:Porin family protein n=1 Tax=Moritella marina ATCC 15381 TaxID=1202962 RepID=A0A5J6WMU2_MORMI|nr:porin family protein [Moritella marina]QFI39436.1 porin family protein [Moritella marina ATCC 15381]